MSGCIDDVDAMIQPETSRRGRRNSNAAFLLLGHPVHSSCTFMHLTHTVNFLGVEEYTLCSGRFTSIYMSNNTNISGFFQWKFSRHMYCYSSRSGRVLVERLSRIAVLPERARGSTSDNERRLYLTPPFYGSPHVS